LSGASNRDRGDQRHDTAATASGPCKRIVSAGSVGRPGAFVLLRETILEETHLKACGQPTLAFNSHQDALDFVGRMPPKPPEQMRLGRKTKPKGPKSDALRKAAARRSLPILDDCHTATARFALATNDLPTDGCSAAGALSDAGAAAASKLTCYPARQHWSP